MVRPLEPKPGVLDGHVGSRVFETQDERARLAGGSGHRGPRPALWSDIGVLTRDNATAESVFDTLTAAGIPVEIVGLSGLLRLPEVAEIVAMLELLHDVTANAAVLTLLNGPRWAIGPRDLRLLRERAAELAGRRGRTESASIGDQLTEIADGIDPAELPALSDALEDPGDAAVLRRGAGALRAARRRAALAPRRTPGSRSSTWSAASSTPPASTSSSPRR